MTSLEKLKKKLRIKSWAVLINSAWSLTEFVAVSVISFSAQFLLIKFLSKEEFGAYQYMYTLSGIIMSFSLTGLATSLVRHVAQGEEKTFKSAFKIDLVWGVVLSFAFLGCSVFYFFQDQVLYSKSLLVFSLTTPWVKSFSAFSPFLQGKNLFKKNTKYMVTINTVFKLAIVGSLFFFKSVFYIILVSQLINLLLNAFFALRVFAKELKADSVSDFEKYSSKEFLRSVKHFSLLNVIGSVGQFFDKFVINFFAGPVGVAQLSMTTFLSSQSRAVIKTAGLAFLPKLSQTDRLEIKKEFWFRTFQCLLIGVLFTGVLFVATEVLFLFFFEKYIEVKLLAQILNLEIIFILVGNYFAAILKSHFMINPLYFLTTMNGLVKLALIALLGWIYGLSGIVGARLISNFLGVLLVGGVLYRELCKSQEVGS